MVSLLSPSICLSGSEKFDGSVAAPEERLSDFVQADRGGRIEPHGAFEVVSPDQVAECFDGCTEELYRALWECVAAYPAGRSECNDDFSDRCVARFWDLFSREEQLALNALAVRHDEEEEAMMASYRASKGA